MGFGLRTGTGTGEEVELRFRFYCEYSELEPVFDLGLGLWFLLINETSGVSLGNRIQVLLANGIETETDI